MLPDASTISLVQNTIARATSLLKASYKHHEMDALVYEDTPIATYFEGEAIPYELPQEQTPPQTPFAPHGLPDFKRRFRKIRRSASSIAPGSAYTDGLIERFRYIIVASQLLSDEHGPRPSLSDHEASGKEITTLRGAIVTAAVSFLVAWAIHWLRGHKRVTRPLLWWDVGTYAGGVVVIGIIAIFVGRRTYTNYLQRASLRTISKYTDDSHSLDTTAGNIIRFIQEVEVVARGYDLGSPLPPISRLEDRQVVRRCQTLRRELAAALKLLTIVMVDNHNALQPYINTSDVQRYHDIYEVSLAEYSQAIALPHQQSNEAQESLKELRFSVKLHSLARKVFLCDLLALRQSKGWSRFHQWSNTLGILRGVDGETVARQSSLSTILTSEEWGDDKATRRSLSTSSQSDDERIEDDATTKLRLRRFDDIAQSVRALNAKAHLLKEEINGLTHSNTEDAVISAAVSKHYDCLGLEIRNLLSDWERGKSTMLMSIETDHERASCSSGSVRTPISPSPSLGALQVVDGGPADAFHLLSGDSPSSLHPKGIFEEEVFEAVASRIPRKRTSISGMTREEKIARLAEERRKRATLQEQSDNTTNMLRELHMVIKHRPKGSLPANNTPLSASPGLRIASL